MREMHLIQHFNEAQTNTEMTYECFGLARKYFRGLFLPLNKSNFFHTNKDDL